MVRHIVFFNFNDDASDKEKAELIEALKGLKDKISLIKELEVGTDIAGTEKSFDLALNILFNSFDDVQEYISHPDHVEVVKLVKSYCKATAKVDYKS